MTEDFTNMNTKTFSFQELLPTTPSSLMVHDLIIGKNITHVTFTAGKNKQNLNHIWPRSELLTLATASCKDKQHSEFKSQDMPSFY